MAERKPDSLIGEQIGQFTVIEEIGRGGMATVYRATQTSINREVALKVLPRAFLHDPGFYERFTREVDVVAHLEHPHIMPIYDFGEHDGMPYIAMRLLNGGSMRSLIEDEEATLRDLVLPVQQVGAALDYAHAAGIIHRDLKPGNILTDENGNAYLSDFGIARVLNSDLTGSAIIGTPAYMSPEQATGDPLDARADVYSLGVVLFELITGREPFIAETPIAMILKHLNERVPYLREFRPDVPHEVDKVIATATEKAPENRYNSAGELAEAFAHAVKTTSTTVSIPVDEAERRRTLGEAETVAPSPEPDTIQTDALSNRSGDDATPLFTRREPTPADRSEPSQDAAATAGASATEVTQAPAPEEAKSIHDMETTRKPEGAPRQRMVIVAAVVLAFLVGAVAAVGTASGTFAAPAVAPTPFVGAQVVETDVYAITIPQDWLPPENTGTPYYDLLAADAQANDTHALIHAWQDVNLTALVTLAQTTNATAADDYARLTYADRDDLTQIDEQQYENGTVRHSYRTTGFDDFPAGQVDVFLLPHADHLMVMELYSADSVGNVLVPTFQQILDSLRLRA